jgi:Asp-tRNA(Asn)/Glu-tRNA(Gln) amidotransferase A subunit family amidase
MNKLYSFIDRVKGENMHHGMTINPEVQTDVPGGSCSGAAVAVAAGLVDFALGISLT